MSTHQKEITTASSYKTELDDRTLWFDGDSSFNPEDLLRAMQHYDVRYVNTIDSTVQEFNRHCSKDQQLAVKQQVKPLCFEWDLPDQYKNLNVREYVLDKLAELYGQIPEQEFKQRLFRVIKEMTMYESRGLFDVLRAIIFVINTLT